MSVVTTDPRGHDDLDGFTAGVRRALTLAEREARALGHERIGTEHLLLGLLTEEGSAAATALAGAGAVASAVRRKVHEAVGTDRPVTIQPTRSARAVRAIGRAPRFARDAGATAVGSEHLLLAVLDVEGTAGQVLRGLGVDVEHLRGALGDPRSIPSQPTARPAQVVRCPSCHAPLDGGVIATVVPTGHDGTAEATLLGCPACGTVLGTH